VTVLAAISRDDVASYISAVVWVYTLLIFAYIVTSLLFSFGVRIPYNRWTDAVLSFLRDVCEPYLRIFRRFIPLVGPLDLSPIVAIFALQIVANWIVVPLVRG
jgi:YggT family protein